VQQGLIFYGAGFGTSMDAAASDIAFALVVLKNAGFEIRQPANVDLQRVSCQMLGLDLEDGVEELVRYVARAVEFCSEKP